ncbi:MAG: hypothetical protein IPH82_29050 [Chloroflexi bacterium]|nr:hypothetical protein [Chloroflexota bacterium]
MYLPYVFRSASATQSAKRPEVLTRLLQLVHQRHAEEVAQAEKNLTQSGKGR